MNWYKKAQFETKKRTRLFNYLKSLNIKHIFYHGTSEKIYENIKKTGYIMSPSSLNTKSIEDREWGQGRVFYTSSFYIFM
ncbi:unnamed protein product [marine sediment metagenome]|uniref:Uncharacterized protein n=1 Tax=marine sediment metagenome TaxID=412755 RepID=X1AP88_9ZZZZ